MLSFLRSLYRTSVVVGAAVVGGLLTHSNPTVGSKIAAIYALWTPEAAPFVVAGIGALIGGITVSWFLRDLSAWHKLGEPAREKIRADREILNAQIAAADKKRDDADKAAEFERWTIERLAPWKSLLDTIEEPALYAEVEARFRKCYGVSRKEEQSLQDGWMAVWLVSKAVDSHKAGAAVDEPRVFAKLDRAFCLAGGIGAWRQIRVVTDAGTVLVPFFKGQASQLIALWGGVHDRNGEFGKFTAWILSGAPQQSAMTTSATRRATPPTPVLVSMSPDPTDPAAPPPVLGEISATVVPKP